MPRPHSLVAPLLWTAYVLIPAGDWGVFHGIPIALAGAAMLFAIWWTWTVRGRLPGKALLALVVLMKLVAGLLLTVDRGLQADYFANAEWAPPTERSTEFHSRFFTRLDRALNFGPGRNDFPLYFFNDVTRFNFYEPGQPDRGMLPFSVTWQGVINAERTEDRRTFYLRGRGVTAELWIDGTQAVHLNPSSDEAIDRALWPAGLHRLTVRLTVPEGATREFEAGYIDPRGVLHPFDASIVTPRPYRPWRVWTGRVVRVVGLAFDALMTMLVFALFLWTVFRLALAIVLRSASRRAAIGWLIWIPMMCGALMFAAPAVNAVELLPGGEAALAYESSARAILLNPFNLQSVNLYAYFVSAVHLIFGEGLAGIYLVQWLLACVAMIVVWRIGIGLFGPSVWKGLLALCALYFIFKLVPAARLLLAENLFTPLLAMCAAATIAAAERRAKRPVAAMAMIAIVIVGIINAAPAISAERLNNLWRRALYSLGFFDVYRPGEGTSPLYIATWAAALVGMSAIISGQIATRTDGAARFLPFLISVSYFFLVTAFFPVGGFIMPLYILLLPYAALGAWWTTTFLVPPEEE